MHSVFNVYAFVCACQTRSFFYFLVISKLLQRLKKISTTFNFYIKKGNIKCYIFSKIKSTTLQKVEAGFDGMLRNSLVFAHAYCFVFYIRLNIFVTLHHI